MSYYYYGRRKRSVGSIALFVLFLIGIGLMVALYYVKTLALSARSEVHELEQYVAEEQSAISVLQAEIAYLENPKRLATLAKDELGLEAISVDQVISEADIAKNFSIRPEAIEQSRRSLQPAQSGQAVIQANDKPQQTNDSEQSVGAASNDGGQP